MVHRPTRARRLLATVAVGAVVAAGLIGGAGASQAQSPALAAPMASGTDKLNDVYYTLQHNTFDYGSTLTGWLDQGLRSVELDIIDKDAWENDANGPYVSHDGSSANKNCSANPDRLGNCLRDLAAWQTSHPGTGPLIVFVDLKASWDPANAWNADEVDLLDAKVRSILGSRMYTAAELFTYATGNAWTPGGTTLRNAVNTAGWPTLSALDNRIVVAYTGGRIGFANQTQSDGIAHILAASRLPSGFFCPDVEADPSELDPGATVDGMTSATSQVAVCSNLKSQDNYQVTANRSATRKQLLHLWGDHVFGADSAAYNMLAVAHGASAIGRESDAVDTHRGLIPPVGKRRSLPGYFQLRPDSAPANCLTIDGAGTSNGTAAKIAACTSSTAQRFVWTAEGQLRPQHDNPGCLDISGGTAGAGKKIHLWDCDGGDSEKWTIDTTGVVRAFTSQSWCLTIAGGGSSIGTQFTTVTCSGTAGQKFTLTPVAGWAQTDF